MPVGFWATGYGQRMAGTKKARLFTHLGNDFRSGPGQVFGVAEFACWLSLLPFPTAVIL